ncbi:hypothetical protein QO010_000386 [Caulobacter ginsengisoli]|uniref:Uncharacterized protein n=1 Tax=Caulobacter ginsengisoli TaxID=400775 RepID=A0ABU0IKU9_9CAUL|nr:hypothetical protein [Caulobacter ginsengisoli]MDQ0462638.1 hypothetical protein [Caulobacter ginsengisoli]
MPKINLTVALCERDGSPMMEDDKTEFSLKRALLRILDTPLPDDQHGVGKLRLAQLGLKVAAGAEGVELTNADTTLLLDRAAKLANALVFGQLVLALDPGQLAQPQ